VVYLSKSLNKTEKNYKIHNKEMLAVIRGLENWRHLLEDKNLLQNKLLTNGDGPYASYFHHMIKTYI